MNSRSKWLGGGAAAVALLIAACASQPDRFYTLSESPAGERDARVEPRRNVVLSVTVPSTVDRSEMVLGTAHNRVEVLDHERWAAPLADQVAQVLARDIEHRRGDVLVADQRFVQDAAAPIFLQVDVVALTVQRAGHATVQAHWRIASSGAGIDRLGSGSFDVAVEGGDYAAIARALSECLGALAERLAGELPP